MTELYSAELRKKFREFSIRDNKSLGFINRNSNQFDDIGGVYFEIFNDRAFQILLNKDESNMEIVQDSWFNDFEFEGRNCRLSVVVCNPNCGFDLLWQLRNRWLGTSELQIEY